MERDSKLYLQERGPITSGFIGRLLSVCVQGGGRGDMLPESTGGWVPGVELTDEEGALAARKQEAGSAPARPQGRVSVSTPAFQFFQL